MAGVVAQDGDVEPPPNNPEPTLRAYLAVKGDFDPEAFTATVGLSPDETERRGQRSATNPRLAGRTVPVCDHWRLGVPKRAGFDLEPVVAELLHRLEGHEARLGQAAEHLGLSVFLVVVAQWDSRTTSAPAIALDVEQIATLAVLRASLDVDLYP